MQASVSMTESISGAVPPVTALLADKTLRPRLPCLSGGPVAEKNPAKNGAARSWEIYLARAYERYSLAETGTSRDLSRRLEDWYFPLKVKSPRFTRPVL